MDGVITNITYGTPRFSREMLRALMLLVPKLLADATDAEAASIAPLWPDYAIGETYRQRDVVRHDGVLYRCSQPTLTAQEGQEPWRDGMTALWTRITVAADGIDVWQAPTGAHDAYNTGVRVHYPDADGPVYVSKRDGNTSEPSKDEWWTLSTE